MGKEQVGTQNKADTKKACEGGTSDWIVGEAGRYVSSAASATKPCVVRGLALLLRQTASVKEYCFGSRLKARSHRNAITKTSAIAMWAHTKKTPRMYLGFVAFGVRKRHRVAAVAAPGHRRAEGQAEHAAGGEAAVVYQLADVAGPEGAVPLPVAAVEVGHVLHHREDRHLR